MRRATRIEADRLRWHSRHRVHDDLVEAIPMHGSEGDFMCRNILPSSEQGRILRYTTPTTMTCMTSLSEEFGGAITCALAGVAYWRRLTRFFNCMVRMGIRDRRAFGSLCAGPVQLQRNTHVETGSRKQSTQLFYKIRI
jgi:hypothetical protein